MRRAMIDRNSFGKKWEERTVTSSAELYAVVAKWARQRTADFRTGNVPHLFAKVRVAGSNPVVRSQKVLVGSYFRDHSRSPPRAVAHGLPMACPWFHGSMAPSHRGADPVHGGQRGPSTYLTLQDADPVRGRHCPGTCLTLEGPPIG